MRGASPRARTRERRSGGTTREVHLLQPHAVAAPARGLPRDAPLGVGGPRQPALRRRRGQRHVPRVHGRARVRRGAGLRRHRRERAPPERLRAHALAEHHRRRPGPAHQPGRHLRDRQLHRPLQPAGAGGRGVRHARRHLGRAVGGRLPGGHADGHQLLLRAGAGVDARQVRRGPRADPPGVGRARPVRLRRQVHPAAPREHLAPAAAAAPPARVHPGRGLGGDVGLLRRARLQLLLPVLQRLQAGQEAARRLLGAHGRAGQGRLALPGGLRPDHRRGRQRRRGRGALRRAHPLLLQPAACTCSPASPTRRATGR